MQTNKHLMITSKKKKKIKLNKFWKKTLILKKKNVKKLITKVSKTIPPRRCFSVNSPSWELTEFFSAEISMFLFKAAYWTLVCTHNPNLIWKEMTYETWYFLYTFIRFLNCYVFFMSVLFLMEFGEAHTESDIDVLHKSFFDDKVSTSTNILLELPENLDENPLNKINTKHNEADFHIVIIVYAIIVYCFKILD